MAIQRKQNFLGGQRVDVPHLRSIESGVAADFAELVNGFVSDGNTNHIIRGMLTNDTSGGVNAGTWYVQLANSVVLSKTDELCLFAFPSSASNVYPFQGVSFSDGVDYYFGVKITSITSDPQTVKFIDDVTGLEISKTVPLAIVLSYEALPLETSTDSDPNTIWVYKVQTEAGLVKTSKVEYPTGTRYPFIFDDVKYTNLLDWIQAIGAAAGDAIGPAGGVLGYTGSTYPDPNGLAPLDGVIGPLDTIPIKAGTAEVSFAVDARTVDGTEGSHLRLLGGAGGDSDAASTVAGGGGRIYLYAGASGADNGAGLGNGGSVFVRSGYGDIGGDTRILTKVGASQSGTVYIRDHDLASKSGTPPAGVNGGGIEISTLRGGPATGSVVPGEGGPIEIRSGAGGSASSAYDAGGAGDIAIIAGFGGSASADHIAGIAGEVEIDGGTGGAGSETMPASDGGDVTIKAGSSGTDNGGGGANGGKIYVSSGNSSSGGTSGSVQITTAPITVPGLNPTLAGAAVGSTGGNFLVKNQDGGEGDPAYVPGNGGSALFLCGDGGSTGSSSTNGGNGGGFAISTGAGGAGDVGLVGGDGGDIILQASAGGPSNGGTAGDGGAIVIVTGTGGSASTGTGGSGGAVAVSCGFSTGNKDGAYFLAVAGRAGGSGTGGAMVVSGGNTATGTGGLAGLTGGSATGAGTGGNVSVQAGNGSVADGDVLIGTVNGAKVGIGIPGRDVQTRGRNVEAAVEYEPAYNVTIPVNTPTILLQPSATVTVTATPALQTTGITAGTKVTLIGNSANRTRLPREGAVGGSGLRLSSDWRDIDQYCTLTLMFDGIYWCEVSFANNS